MARRCKGKDEHRIRTQMDPQVQSQCGPGEVWTPTGIREMWFCGHHRVCTVCKRVVAEEASCPFNKLAIPQQRRWK